MCRPLLFSCLHAFTVFEVTLHCQYSLNQKRRAATKSLTRDQSVTRPDQDFEGFLDQDQTVSIQDRDLLVSEHVQADDEIRERRSFSGLQIGLKYYNAA